MRLSAMLPAAQGATADKLREVVAELDSVIRDIRTTIFDLQTEGSVGGGLRANVRHLVADAAERLGFPPRARFSGPVDTVVDRDAAEQLLAVLREALSNVIRHADATSVEVEVVAGQDLALVVADDGVGTEPDQGGGSGLRNMASRAAALHGTFVVGPHSAGGTMVEWRVPLGGSPTRI